MKCPQCSRKHPYKQGMRCTCSYQFTFDPKKQQMTDGRFLAVVRKVSGNGTHYYTLNQLHAELCRRAYRRPLAWGLAALAAAIVAISLTARMALAGGPEAMVAALIFAWIVTVLLTAVWIGALMPPPRLETAQSYVHQWLKDGKSLDKLLTEPSLQQPPPQWPEPDIYDYGVERILVVDRDLLVDLFVANGFHTEHRTLVISAQGYPDYLATKVRQLLAENPRLSVFLLHDPTPSGAALREKVMKTYDLPPDRVIDLGLAPDDVLRMRAFRPLKPKQDGYEATVDSLLWPRLAQVTAVAVASGMTFGALLDRAAAGAASGGDGGGSGGEVGISVGGDDVGDFG